MLTIGQLADYVGVTPRAIRHYHHLGLLFEPERTSSGYRSYTAQHVIDLQRIKVLTSAGVPLARVRELIDADPQALRDAVAELDGSLRSRIRALQRTRRSLAALAEGNEPFIPPELSAMHDRLRRLGVSPRTLTMERDAWILVQVLYPHLVLPWLRSQASMLDDPAYRDLYLLTDQAFDWPPDDPRIEEVARRTLAWVSLMHAKAPPYDPADYGSDTTAYSLVVNYRREASPGWRRLMERVEELATEASLGNRPGPDA